MKRGTFITAKLITTCQTYRAILSADRFISILLYRAREESYAYREAGESLVPLSLSITVS